MNKALHHLKHELNHGDRTRQLNALTICIASLICSSGGRYYKQLAEIAKRLEYNEEMILYHLIKSFGEGEFERIKELWDSYSDTDEDKEEQ